MKLHYRLIVQKKDFYLIEIFFVDGVGYFWRYAEESKIYKTGFIPSEKNIYNHLCYVQGWTLISYEEL